MAIEGRWTGLLRKASAIFAYVRRQKGFPVLPVAIIGAVVFVAIFANVVSPHDPLQNSLPERRMPPAWVEGGSTKYLLGTDSLGRDLVSRLFHGARVAVLIVVSVLIVSGVGALVLGILAGYLGGWVDIVIMRVVDGFIAFPGILLALLLIVSLGPGMLTMIIALIVLGWSTKTRVIRGEVLSLRNRDYVVGARAIGCSPIRIMLVHIMPMTFNTFLVLLSLSAGGIILSETSLSFLGAGIPIPTPTWGQMVSEGRRFIASAWWLSVFPGLAISLVVLAFNLFGDWLRDLLDPTLRGR